MEELKKLINDCGAFTICVVTMLVDKFGDFATLDIGVGIAEYFKNEGYELDQVENEIYNYEDGLNNFIREKEIDVIISADLLFTQLGFAKKVKDNYITYTYDADDYKIEVIFNMVENTYKNIRYYQGAIDLDYEVETVLHEAISQFIVENFR